MLTGRGDASLTTMVSRPIKLLILFGTLAAWIGGTTAHAFDRVTLRNGFSYDCVRQQPIDAAHTRLFLTSDTDASYIDIPTTEILAVDPVPAQPQPAAQPHTASAATASPDLHTLLASAGTAHNIDVELLASIIHAESSGRTRAVSRAGAGGLMQLMPATAHGLGVTDAFQPDQNINGGTTYLDSLLTRYHDNLALALAAYNAGPGAVDRYHGIPPYRETRAYVVRVMNEFKRRKLVPNHQPAPTLQASR